MKMARVGSSRMILFAMAVVCLTGTGTAQQFRFANISVPKSINTEVLGLNDLGAVVGVYNTKYAGHGFMSAGGKITNIDYPGTTSSTICYGINNSAEIVGQYVDTESVSHAFLYANGTYTNVDPPGAQSAAATGINNLGQIVGEYYIYPTWYGFLFDGTNYQTLSVPGAANTYLAGGVNDNGQVTLQWAYANSSTVQSSVYSGASYTEIEITGAADVYAYGINNKGDIALLWVDSDTGLSQAALRLQNARGQYVYPSIEDPLQSENDSTRAYGVSNKAVVAGYYIGSTGDVGFAASPVQ